MKKAFLTIAMILGGLSTFANRGAVIKQANEILIGIDGQYKRIKISELPKAVINALAADFNSATIEKAYVNQKQEYKLQISVQEVTSAVHTEKVYADKKGNWIGNRKVLNPVNKTHHERLQNSI